MRRANWSARAFSKHELDLFDLNWSTDRAKLNDLLFVLLARNIFNHR
jgi:hypothetical protein